MNDAFKKLSATEIVDLLMQDLEWTLPPGSGNERIRMAEAWLMREAMLERLTRVAEVRKEAIPRPVVQFTEPPQRLKRKYLKQARQLAA